MLGFLKQAQAILEASLPSKEEEEGSAAVEDDTEHPEEEAKQTHTGEPVPEPAEAKEPTEQVDERVKEQQGTVEEQEEKEEPTSEEVKAASEAAGQVAVVKAPASEESKAVRIVAMVRVVCKPISLRSRCWISRRFLSSLRH